MAPNHSLTDDLGGSKRHFPQCAESTCTSINQPQFNIFTGWFLVVVKGMSSRMDLPTCSDCILVILLHRTHQDVQQRRRLAIKSSVLFTRERLFWAHRGLLLPRSWARFTLSRLDFYFCSFTSPSQLPSSKCHRSNLLLNCSFISQTSIPAVRWVRQRPLKAQGEWQENEIRLPRGLPVQWT